MGKGVFSEDNFDYILYLSVAELFLDGQKIEGRGVRPDFQIDYPANRYKNSDPQLESAKSEILKLIL